MKKNLFLIMAIFVSVVFISCDKNNDGNGGGSGGGGGGQSGYIDPKLVGH
jgi:hypothetical protein